MQGRRQARIERQQANTRARAEAEEVSSGEVRQSSRGGGKSESGRNNKRVAGHYKDSTVGHHKDSTDSDMQWALPDTHEAVREIVNAADAVDSQMRGPLMSISPKDLMHKAMDVVRPFAKVGAFGVGLLASVVGSKTSIGMINGAGPMGGYDAYAEEDSSLNLVRWTK